MAKRKKCLEGIFEPALRRVRVEFGGETIADSNGIMLLRESSYQLHYMFPESDVNMKFLTRTDHVETSKYKGDAHFWNVRVGDKAATHAAFTYPNDPVNDRPDVRGYFAFKWDAMDAWYEEDEQVFGHPRDPYHRVDIIPSSRHIRVEVNGTTVAETNSPMILFETGLPARYYIPKDDVRMDILEPTDLETICPYKGFASYWTIKIDGETFENLVWGYEDPVRESSAIRGLVSFYNEKLDIYVDGQLESRPRTVFA